MVLVDGEQRYKERAMEQHDIYKSVNKYNSQKLNIGCSEKPKVTFIKLQHNV